MAGIGTISEYKATYRPSMSTGIVSDATITFALNAVNDFLKRYTGRVFDSNEFIETYSGNDSGTLILRNTPIYAITSIKAVYSDGSTYTLNSHDYRFSTETGVVQRINSQTRVVTMDSFGAIQEPNVGTFPSFKDGFLNYLVEYVGGYDTGTTVTSYAVPIDLKLSVYRCVDDVLGLIGVRGSGDLGSDSKDKRTLNQRWGERFLQYRHMGASAIDANVM